MITSHLLEYGRPLVRCKEIPYGALSSFSHASDQVETADLIAEQKTVLLRSFADQYDSYNWNQWCSAEMIMYSFHDPYDISKREAYRALSFLVQIGLLKKEARSEDRYYIGGYVGETPYRKTYYCLTSKGLDIYRELKGFNPNENNSGWGW